MTKEQLFSRKERTFVMIKPDCYAHTGKIVDMLLAHGFTLTKVLMLRMNEEMVSVLFPDSTIKAYFRELTRFLTSDVVVGMEVVGESAIHAVKQLAGNQMGKESATIRGLFAVDQVKNAVHVSENEENYQREDDVFFSEKFRHLSPAILTNCSLCIIKPHAFACAGKIIDRILDEGFEISAMQSFFLDRATAEEFFELYKGVVPDYSSMIDQMVSGPCLAMEVRQDNVVHSFKSLCGCYDPEVGARKGETGTLR